MSNSEKRSLLRGFESAIFDLLYTGADEEQLGHWLRVPLLHAVAAGDLGLVIKLVNAGAFGNPLCAAIAGGQVTLARDLMERGAPVTETDENDDSPLRLAAAVGDEETMSLLLQKGACPNTEDRGSRSLLYSAAANGRLATVNLLLAAGADTSLRYFGMDYLFSGVYHNAYGRGPWYCSDRDAGDDNSALDVAVANGHVGVVIALTRSGVDVNAVDSKHATALHKAACSTTNEADVIDVLVKAGADVNAVSALLSRVPLHCASEAGTLGAILALLKNGARINEKDCEGRTPLHLTALKDDHLPAMEALLAAGADVNAIDDTNKTALHLTALRGNLPAMKALLAAGAGMDAIDCAGATALHNAAMCHGRNLESSSVAELFDTRRCSKKDAENAVDLLLRWGADETAVDAKGKIPLEGAVTRFGAVARFGLDDSGRLRDLLTKAPFDRNWRRRGWLLLCRAYRRRMVPIPGTDEAPSSTRERCRARSVSTEVIAGGACFVPEGAVRAVEDGEGAIAPGGWNGVVTWVAGMESEGVFRNIVGYL